MQCVLQVAALRFNATGTLLASGGLDGVSAMHAHAMPEHHHVLPLAASLAVCVHAGRVGVWEAGSGKCRHVLEGPDGAIEWLDWHPRGDLILAGSEDFTTWLWNAQTGVFMAVGSLLPQAKLQQMHIFAIQRMLWHTEISWHPLLPVFAPPHQQRSSSEPVLIDIEAPRSAGVYRACRASAVWPLHSRRKGCGDGGWRK